LLWVTASALFALYLSHFNSYNKTYGSLGAVVVLLIWLYLSAFCVLLGAELNSEMERQTGRDTTKGQPESRGQRGAFSADHLGESRA
jgi:membrane protein